MSKTNSTVLHLLLTVRDPDGTDPMPTIQVRAIEVFASLTALQQLLVLDTAQLTAALSLWTHSIGSEQLPQQWAKRAAIPNLKDLAGQIRMQFGQPTANETRR